jgi:hypothetical protein
METQDLGKPQARVTIKPQNLRDSALATLKAVEPLKLVLENS